jgi:hypothetical protein
VVDYLSRYLATSDITWNYKPARGIYWPKTKIVINAVYFIKAKTYVLYYNRMILNNINPSRFVWNFVSFYLWCFGLTKFSLVQNLTFPVTVTCVVGKLDGVDCVNFKSQNLQYFAKKCIIVVLSRYCSVLLGLFINIIRKIYGEC